MLLRPADLEPHVKLSPTQVRLVSGRGRQMAFQGVILAIFRGFKFESLRVLPFSVWCVASIRNYRFSARAEGTIADDVRLFLMKYDSTFFVVVRGPTIVVGYGIFIMWDVVNIIRKPMFCRPC